MDYAAEARAIALDKGCDCENCVGKQSAAILALVDKARQAQAEEPSGLLEEMVRLLSNHELVINAPSIIWAMEWESITNKVKSWHAALGRK